MKKHRLYQLICPHGLFVNTADKKSGNHSMYILNKWTPPTLHRSMLKKHRVFDIDCVHLGDFFYEVCTTLCDFKYHSLVAWFHQLAGNGREAMNITTVMIYVHEFLREFLVDYMCAVEYELVCTYISLITHLHGQRVQCTTLIIYISFINTLNSDSLAHCHNIHTSQQESGPSAEWMNEKELKSNWKINNVCAS